jgi:hypothetical protein
MKFGKKCGNMCLLFFQVEKNLKVATLVGTAGDSVLVTAAAIPFCVTVDLNDLGSMFSYSTILEHISERLTRTMHSGLQIW